MQSDDGIEQGLRNLPARPCSNQVVSLIRPQHLFEPRPHGEQRDNPVVLVALDEVFKSECYDVIPPPLLLLGGGLGELRLLLLQRLP